MNGNVSSYDIAKSLETIHSTLLKWGNQYEHIGVEAFIKSYTKYTTQLKQDVLNFKIENSTSLNEKAAIFGIASYSTILQWRKQFETKGFDALQSRGSIQSMSGKGNYSDNSVMEDFFDIMKSKFLYLKEFESVEQFKKELKNHINYYNTKRIKAKLKLSLVQYRTQFTQVA